MFIVVHEEEEDVISSTSYRVNGFNILTSKTSSLVTSIDTIFFVFILTATCILIKPLLFFHLSLIHSPLFVTLTVESTAIGIRSSTFSGFTSEFSSSCIFILTTLLHHI